MSEKTDEWVGGWIDGKEVGGRIDGWMMETDEQMYG